MRDEPGGEVLLQRRMSLHEDGAACWKLRISVRKRRAAEPGTDPGASNAADPPRHLRMLRINRLRLWTQKFLREKCTLFRTRSGSQGSMTRPPQTAIV